MKSVKETVKIRMCKGGAWERVDGALEYMPLNYVKRTLILSLLSSYSCLLEAVSKRLEIDANSGFMVTYNSNNDIVECECESDDESSESDEDEETTPVENKNCKVENFWNMPPLLKTPVLDIKKK
ncbi:hypothetical protein Tco_1291311, partial [Tanacetum coccineum]